MIWKGRVFNPPLFFIDNLLGCGLPQKAHYAIPRTRL